MREERERILCKNFMQGGAGCEGDDKGCAEQVQGEIKARIIAIYCYLFVYLQVNSNI